MQAIFFMTGHKFNVVKKELARKKSKNIKLGPISWNTAFWNLIMRPFFQ